MKSYRFNGRGLPLAEQVKAALEHFEANVGLPGVVVVNPKVKAEVEAVIAALGAGAGTAPLQVRAVGGCLVGEVWVGLVSPGALAGAQEAAQ